MDRETTLSPFCSWEEQESDCDLLKITNAASDLRGTSEVFPYSPWVEAGKYR